MGVSAAHLRYVNSRAGQVVKDYTHSILVCLTCHNGHHERLGRKTFPLSNLQRNLCLTHTTMDAWWISVRLKSWMRLPPDFEGSCNRREPGSKYRTNWPAARNLCKIISDVQDNFARTRTRLRLWLHRPSLTSQLHGIDHRSLHIKVRLIITCQGKTYYYSP